MEFLSKAVVAIIPACININSSCIKSNLSYPFNASDNVKALDSATDKLVATQDDVKSRVDCAELQGLRQINQVGVWLDRVAVVKEEVDEIRRRYEERSRCVGGRSFNFWSNYWISKDATKKLKEVQELCGLFLLFEEVAIQLAPRIQEFPVASTVVPKEEADLQKILRYIDNDHDDIIGIWGMGGVGKTRLLHLIHNSYKQSSSFEVVLFVTASQDCSVEKIQAELCEKYKFGKGSGVHSQAQIISNYLCNRNFLLLLDDLWDRIDLQSVGIPLPLGVVNNQFKRKVVITTRKLQVCGLMEVKQSHMVACLDSNDALSLFSEKVGDETMKYHPQIPSLSRQIVAELDGLPLALITIGRAMYGKKDPREWEDAIELLQNSRLNEIETAREEERVYYRLKFSYDSLETKELRDCFLACSLWPEDYPIPKEQLIECWLGLGVFHASDARNIYNPGYTLIGKLLSACLLEDAGSGNVGSYVKMHDVIRDMALWLASDFGNNRDKWIVRSGVGVHHVLHEKGRWCKTERVTLLNTENKPIDFISCQANNLHFLKIQYCPTTINLGSFCALTFLELYECYLDIFPPAIPNLVNLRYLNLSCNQISSVPQELKLLINLKYFFLANNRIVSFPMGVLSELRELRVLDLMEAYQTEAVRVVDELEYMTWLIQEFEYLDNMRCLQITLQRAAHFQSLLELSNLPIRSLRLDWQDEIDLLLIPPSFIGNAQIQDNLQRLYLGVRSVEKVVIESDSQNPCCHLKSLERLFLWKMEVLEMIIWRNVTPEDLFLKLNYLRISRCGKLKDISWALQLPCLTELLISNCASMVQLITHSGLASASATQERKEMKALAFTSLKYLTLRELPELQIICDQSIMFPSLESFIVDACPMLKKLPFQLSTVPTKLTTIEGERIWWDQLQCEHNDLKTVLENLYEEI